jgi:two-component system, LytTR family, response regulator
MIRVVITDDEPTARAGLRALLAHEPDLTVVGECANAAATLRALVDLAPDLLFLDVQLPGLSGIELLDRIPPTRAPVVVFVTAYDQYAVPAFDHHAADYLLKPYSDDRFRLALSRARQRLEHRELRGLRQRVLDLAAAVDPGSEPIHADSPTSPHYITRLVVKSARRTVVVSVDQITWIEAAGDYARLHVDTKSYLHRATMAELEARLDPSRFVRIHRSTIVNIGALAEVRQVNAEEYVAMLTNGCLRPVSKRGRENLGQLLGTTP